MAFFRGIKRYRRFYIGERMYRGKNQDYITDETLFSTIKSV